MNTNDIKYSGYKLFKRGNSWYIYIGEELTGKVIRESLRTTKQSEAIEFGRRRYAQLKGDAESSKQHPNSFAKRVEEFLRANTSPTHRTYMRRCFIPYFTQTIGNRDKINDIAKITSMDIRKYLDYRRTRPSQKGKKNIPVKPATIIRENTTLKAFFKWCYETGRIKKPLIFPTLSGKENIFDENGEPVFDDLSGHRDSFSDDEMKIIFKTLEKEIDAELNQHTKRRKQLLYNYISILYHSGIRTCELRNVVWSQFVPEYREGGIFKNVYSGKQKKKRDIALSPETVAMLLRLKDEQKAFCDEHNLPFDEDEVKIISLCLSNLEQNRFELRQVKEFDNGFRKLLDRCGIKHKNQKVLYSFRHSYISKLMENGTPVTTIAKQCGTSCKMIEQYYDQSSHLSNMPLLFV